jgi:hypothetical protein
MARVVAHYDLEGDPEAALDRMVEAEIETVLRHELGEVEAGTDLDPEWPELLAALSGTPAELVARAARDHLADCLSTLPFLAGTAPVALDFYAANLRGVRRELFPALLEYAERRASGGADARELLCLAERGAAHWRRTCHDLLAAFAEDPGRAAQRIERLARCQAL